MPSIQDAMIRSLQGGMLEHLPRQAAEEHVDLARDLAAASGAIEATANEVIKREDISNTMTDVSTAFSSWDNCMAASFCKWPRGGGGEGGKYLDEPYIPPNQGYTSNAPMAMGTASSSYGGAQKSGPPQYADFDVNKNKGGDDALPEMPSWEGAASKKVMLEEGVELDQLKKTPAQNASSTNVPLMAGAVSAGPRSPSALNPPAPFPAGAASNGYGNSMTSVNSDPYAAAPAQSAYSRGASPYGQQPQDQYGMAGAGGPGRRSPGNSPYGNGGYGQQGGGMDSYGRISPRAQDPYSQQPTNPLDMGFQRSISPQGYGNGQGYDNGQGHDNGYGRRSPGRGGLTPAGGNGYEQRSYSPGYGSQQQPGYGGHQGGPYGPPQPQRTYTGESQRPLAPQRQYTGNTSPGPQAQSSGFDFGAGYTRPTPPARSGTGESYPGRKAYQAQGGQGW
ncbi:hypothetical protein MKZ38_008417 [Zalerion maritima]|uniref:Uncharacterized protein n=1 Tax=Zalerion maritima TaxID=339359 RepID=A0AAD5WMR2_9PEZI|nr:hypothetical protein MKZ38_008417 [Zalerion maritima]